MVRRSGYRARHRSGVQHGEQTSHLALAPEAIRGIVNRILGERGIARNAGGGDHHFGARYFLRQIVEPSVAQPFLPGA